uniref:Uncharacterized protein n=1 Tax=Toxoplasma gondii (strain ATCC 50861 / VEG) TaxID=432359 RepID=A0A0F7UU65_TOXGV|nr:TPA: hypothetical protein BN1205_008640 [Toxoplasma gondii VEG]
MSCTRKSASPVLMAPVFALRVSICFVLRLSRSGLAKGHKRVKVVLEQSSTKSRQQLVHRSARRIRSKAISPVYRRVLNELMCIPCGGSLRQLASLMYSDLDKNVK